MPSKVTVYTDHQALQYLMKAKVDKPLKGRLARWLDFLADFRDLTVIYAPGENNVVADALSRCPVFSEMQQAKDVENQRPPQQISSAGACLTTVQLRAKRRRRQDDSGPEQQTDPRAQDERIHPVFVGDERWVEALKRCPVFGSAYKRLLEQPDSEGIFVPVCERDMLFKLNGVLLVVRHQGAWRLCVPDCPIVRQSVLYQFHDHPTAGHVGVSKTYKAISRVYYWPGIRKAVQGYVESCVRCRASKALTQKAAGTLQPLQIPTRRWTHVSLDFITALPMTAKGHDAVLTIVDSLSKMAHFIPTQTSVTTAGVVDLLADRLVRYHGIPTKLISDRDPRFVSELWKLFCKRFQIHRALSTAYHPQSDGQTERVHRTLEQMIRTYIQTDETAWEQLLPALELAYNCTTHSTTELSPFEVMIGENPLRAQDLDLVDQLEPMQSPPMTKLFQQLVDRASAHITRAKEQQKLYADKKRRPVQYQPGDKVWVSIKYFTPEGCPKFHPRFIGPFLEVERIGEVAYRVQLPPSLPHHPVFHVSLMQADKQRDPQLQSAEGWEPVVL